MNLAALRALSHNDLENFLVAADPGGIEAQEARGQSAFVSSTTLPRRGNGHNSAEIKALLEAMGITFGKEVDDLFVEAILPKGWTKKATDHSMWSHLVDEKGRERASIFYKAAFYDRNAFISLTPFITTREEYFDADGHTTEDYNHYKTGRHIVKTADGEILFTSSQYAKKDWDAHDAAGSQCVEWLKEHRPEHRNPIAYWTK